MLSYNYVEPFFSLVLSRCKRRLRSCLLNNDERHEEKDEIAEHQYPQRSVQVGHMSFTTYKSSLVICMKENYAICYNNY